MLKEAQTNSIDRSNYYASPDSDRPEERGHIVGGWSKADHPDGSTTLTHERFQDKNISPEEMARFYGLQQIMSELAISGSTHGEHGQLLPAGVSDSTSNDLNTILLGHPARKDVPPLENSGKCDVQVWYGDVKEGAIYADEKRIRQIKARRDRSKRTGLPFQSFRDK